MILVLLGGWHVDHIITKHFAKQPPPETISDFFYLHFLSPPHPIFHCHCWDFSQQTTKKTDTWWWANKHRILTVRHNSEGSRWQGRAGMLDGLLLTQPLLSCRSLETGPLGGTASPARASLSGPKSRWSWKGTLTAGEGRWQKYTSPKHWPHFGKHSISLMVCIVCTAHLGSKLRVTHGC